MEKKVLKKDLSAKEALDFLKKNLESKVEDFQKKCLELRKAEQEALDKAAAKKLAKNPLTTMDTLGSVPSGNTMNMSEKKMAKTAPPGREEQVKELKGKVENPYAVAWASYNKTKAARHAKKAMKMDPTWDPHSKPGKMSSPFSEPPKNPLDVISSVKKPKKQSDVVIISSAPAPAPSSMGKNDTLIDPKNQNDHEKRLKTIEGGQPSVLPGDKKAAEPNKGEGSGGEPEKLKLGKGEFDSSDATHPGKKPKGLGEMKGDTELPLTPLVPQGHDEAAQFKRIRTFLGKKKGALGKAAPLMGAPKAPKAGGALSLSNPGGTPGGAIKTDNPMVKELPKAAMKMRKNMEKFASFKKKKKVAEPVKKDMNGPLPGGDMYGNAGSTAGLGAGKGGGASPSTSMGMIGSKPIGAGTAVSPKPPGGPLGGVGRV